MEPGDDPYELLGLPLDGVVHQQDRSTLDARQIRLAYRKAALQHHPDKQRPGGTQADRQAATRRFAKIAAAYQLLTDATQRAAYDTAAANAAAAAAQPAPSRSPETSPPYQPNFSNGYFHQGHFAPPPPPPFPFSMNFHDPFEVFASAFGFDDGLHDESNTPSANNFHQSNERGREFGATASVFDAMRHNPSSLFGSFFGHGPLGMMHPPRMHLPPPFWHLPPPLPPHAMFGPPPFFAEQGHHLGQHSASFFSSTSSFVQGDDGAPPAVVSTSTSTRIVNGQSLTERVERRADGTVSVQRSSTLNRGRRTPSNAAAAAAPLSVRQLVRTPRPEPPLVIDLLADSPPPPPPPQGTPATSTFETDEKSPSNATGPLMSTRPPAPTLPRWNDGAASKEAETMSGSAEQSLGAGKRAYQPCRVTSSHNDSMHSSQRTGTTTELPGVDSSSSLSSISSSSSLSRAKRQRVAA
jgi:curved DNA-binding protein CbpA